MSKNQLSIIISKLILIVSVVGIGTVFEISEHTLIKSKMLAPSVMAQEKVLNEISISKWSYLESSENIPISFQEAKINITNWILGMGANVAVLIIVYGMMKFILATTKKDKEKKHKAQKIIVYGFIIFVLCALIYAILLPGSVVLQ